MTSRRIVPGVLLLACSALLFPHGATASESLIPIIDARGITVRKYLPNDGEARRVIAVTGELCPAGCTSVSVSLTGNDAVVASPPATMSSLPLASTAATMDAGDDVHHAALSNGVGAACAASVSGAVIVGVRSEDLSDLIETRYGRTLLAIFRGCGSSSKRKLVVAVVGSSGGVDTEDVAKSVGSIWEVATGENAALLSEAYDLEVVEIEEGSGAEGLIDRILETTPPSLASTDVATSIIRSYAALSSSNLDTLTPSVASCVASIDDAYAASARNARAKITAFRSRTSRGLTVSGFGKSATDLFTKTLNNYDRATLSSAGTPAAPYRSERREELRKIMTRGIKECFVSQMSSLQKTALAKFNASLLEKDAKSPAAGSTKATEIDYDEERASIRTAAFKFDTAASALEVPSLALKKDRYVADTTTKLGEVLEKFPDSPEAQLRRIGRIKRKASKPRAPKQRAINAGVNLVAMIRPDGFGNFQGFAGYSLGPHGVIVGVHNDADAPDTINTLGGVRPPFVRIQPKLDLDISL